jgi:hypothetical protein
VTTNGSSTVSGTVVAMNPKGVRLGGQDGWLNVSKYAEGVVLPAPGSRVTLELDKDGYIRAVHGQGAQSTAAPSAAPKDEHTINRLAILKSAAIFASGKVQAGEQISSTQVLVIAEVWLRWAETGERPKVIEDLEPER